METNITSKSAEEIMLLKLGADVLEIAKKIFGREVKIELQIADAPESKVAYIQECNEATKTINPHYAKLTGQGYKILIADRAMPF